MPLKSPTRSPLKPPPLIVSSPAPRRTELHGDDETVHEVSYRGKHLTADDVQNISRLFADVSSIDLSHNILDCMPKCLPPTLVSLNLSFNKFHSLMGFENIRSIRMLCLSHNHIESTWGLAMMTNLEYLDVSYNKIKVIEGLETLTNLVTLLLHHNNIKSFVHLRPLSFNKSLQIVNLQANPVTSHQKYRGYMQQILPALEHLDNISLHRRDRHQPIYDYSTQYVQRQTHPNRPYLLWSETAARWGALEHHAPPPPPPVIIEEPSPLPWRRPPDVVPRPWKGKPLLDSCKKVPPPASNNKSSRRQSQSTIATSESLVHPTDWNKYSRPGSPPKRQRSAPNTGKKSIDNLNTSMMTEVLPSPSPSSPPSPYKYKVTLGTSPRNKPQHHRQYHPSPQSFHHSDSFYRSASSLSDSPERVSSLEAAPPILASPTLRDRMMLHRGNSFSKNDEVTVKNLLSEYQNLSVTDLNRPPPPPLPCDTLDAHDIYDDDDLSVGEHSHSSYATTASHQPSLASIADDVRSVALHIFYEQKKETLSQLKQRRRLEQIGYYS